LREARRIEVLPILLGPRRPTGWPSLRSLTTVLTSDSLPKGLSVGSP